MEAIDDVCSEIDVLQGIIHMLNVLDPAQLTRIESVHRGFLYQHLYSVGCLMLCQAAGVQKLMIEVDEDIELLTDHERLYLQVKTRSNPIVPSDISDTLTRFENLRGEHNSQQRPHRPKFFIIANQRPSVQLQKYIDGDAFPADVIFIYPQLSNTFHTALPPAWESLSDAIAWCIAEAEKLNFSLLSPSSLIWKLAGLVQLAATGSTAGSPHTFQVEDIPSLFEQAIVQLQDFPAPPDFYRPQKHEPPLTSNQHVRIICGLSGAGKTSWAAEAVLHCPEICVYYDVGDLPGPSLASTLVRELAAKFGALTPEGLRKILLPGASCYEALRTLDTLIAQNGVSVLLVMDNAHRIPVVNLRDILNATKRIHFILLCQPHNNVRELEAITGLQRETLSGWDLETVAAAVATLGGFATASGYEQLRTYTGGLPLYVESAAKVAASHYKGDIDALCTDLLRQECSIETAQEVILSRVYQGYEDSVQESLALFSLADVGLSSDEVSELLVKSLNVSRSGAAALIRKMRATGAIEIFGSQTLKVHDAMRALGMQHLNLIESEKSENALKALYQILFTSLHKARDTSRFSLLIQVLIKLNDVMTLIAISGEELFYEMGITVDIMSSLEHASVSDTLEPIHRFWALDGLLFDDIREGRTEKIPQRFKVLDALLQKHEFGPKEKMAYALKRLLFSADNGDATEVEQIVANTRTLLPDAEHERIFDYTHAIALQKLKKYKDSERLCQKVIDGYYNVLGISTQEVMGKNADVLWTIIKRSENDHEHIKHLADSLELYAIVRDAQQKSTPFARIHSMKFYAMVNAPESLVRVGQDLADEFVGRQDYVGAKQVLEDFVLPAVNQSGLVNRLVQVRSQYAVILAYCGQHNEARDEIKRLDPFLEGASEIQRQEVHRQSILISRLAVQPLDHGPMHLSVKLGRNDQCPCGSGKKYKKCHGT